MGLTHHWHRPTELPIEAFRAAASDCRLLLEQHDADVGGFDGTGEAILDEDRIVFNGRAPKACEPFEIAAIEFDRRGRDVFYGHCKTEGLPYDLYVQACLIVVKHHLKDRFQVSSDAPTRDWREARELVQSTLGCGRDFSLDLDGS